MNTKGATESYRSIQKILILLYADHSRNHLIDNYVQRYINNRISCLAVSIYKHPNTTYPLI